MSPCAYLKPTVVQITFDVRRLVGVNKCRIEYAIIVLINYSKKSLLRLHLLYHYNPLFTNTCNGLKQS